MKKWFIAVFLYFVQLFIVSYFFKDIMHLKIAIPFMTILVFIEIGLTIAVLILPINEKIDNE